MSYIVVLALSVAAPAAHAGAPAPDKTATAEAGKRTLPEPESFWMPRVAGYLGFGPLVGAVVPGIQYRHELQRSDSIIFDRTYIQGGMDLVLTPTMAVVRPSFEALPIAFLRFQLAYMGIGYFGVTLGKGHSVSFPSADGPFDSASMDDRKDDGEALFAHRATFNTQLRLKLGPVVLLNELELAGWFIPEGDADQQFFYDSFIDNLAKRGELDATLMNRTLLLFEVWTSDGGGSFMIGFVNDGAQVLL